MLAALLALLGARPALAVDERPLAAPRPPPLTCSADYLKREAPYGLEGVRAAIGQALARKDTAALGFLEERLAEVIGSDAPAALRVVEWAGTAREPEGSLYLRAVRETDAVRAPAVVERLTALAETHPEAGHQVNALIALETQRRLEPAVLERLTALARKDGLDTGVVLHAVRTLGRVMDNDFQRTGRLEPYLGRLLEVARGSREARVRGLALEMAIYPDARIEDAPLRQVAKLQAGDPDPEVREMAARVMSSGRDTQAVLEAFRQSFPGEKNECVRQALVRYAVRAAGARALPLLEDFSRQDARFQRDYAEFKSLYGSGLVDFNQVFLAKPHHHRCESP